MVTWDDTGRRLPDMVPVSLTIISTDAGSVSVAGRPTWRKCLSVLRDRRQNWAVARGAADVAEFLSLVYMAQASRENGL